MHGKKVDLFDSLIWILLVWIVFQDFFLGIFYRVTGHAFLTNLMFYSKDVLMVLLFAWAFIRNAFINRKIILWEVLFMCIFFFAAANGMRQGDIGLKSILASMRGILLLPVFVFVGYAIGDKTKFRKHFMERYMPFLVFVALFGIADYVLDITIGTKSFWTDFVGLGQYMADIKGQVARLVLGLPGNFYTYKNGAYFAQKRLVSFWGGPLTSAYALAIPCIYYFVTIMNTKNRFYGYIKVNRLTKFLGFGVCAIAIALSHTRAMLLLVGMFLVIYYFVKTKKFEYIAYAAPFVILIVIMFSSKIWGYLYNGSTIGHINGIANSIIHLSFLGDGIGSFGVNSAQGTESTYITMMGQMGVVGVILYAMGFLIPIYYCSRKFKKEKMDRLTTVIILCSLVYAVSGVISEQLTAYTTIAPYYILVGCEIGYLLRYEKDEVKYGGLYDSRNCAGQL